MKSIVLVLVIVALVAISNCLPNDYSANRPNKFNLDLILNNDDLLNVYYLCIMGKLPCTPGGEEGKRHIIEALRNGCARCTEKQRAGTHKVLKFLYQNKRDKYNQLAAKYDPEGIYQRYFA